MILLVVLTVAAIAAALFATQNTQTTSITLLQYTLTNIPVYLIALGALLVGIFVSWLINLVGSISSTLALHGKEGTIKDVRKENNELLKQVHKLEIENTRLKTKSGEDSGDDNSL